MGTSPLKLSFDRADVEKEYLRDYDHRNRHFIRLGCVLSIGVWLLISASSHFIFPRLFAEVFFISFGVVIPVLVAVTALTFVRRLTFLFQWASGLANSVTAFAFLYASFNLYYNHALLSGGMVLMSLYAFFIFRLRFRFAALFSTVYMAVYQALLAGLDLPPLDMYISTTMIWAAQGAFLLSGHLMERTSRNLFLSTKTLSDRNREIEHDLVIARMIMDNLLPKNISTLPGIRATSLYIPMDKVGGDFFDLRPDGGVIKLFIADVSGHGLASSYLALITKLSLDKIDPLLGPARVLEELNDFICASTVKSNYATAFLGAIDLESKVFTYASAGHPPVYLYRPVTGDILEIRTRGNALGWFPGRKFSDAGIRLIAGDRLVLYTDGITECANNNGTMFGDERFHDIIRIGESLTPEEFTEKLIGDLHRFSKRSTFDDDITLLVVDII